MPEPTPAYEYAPAYVTFWVHEDEDEKVICNACHRPMHNEEVYLVGAPTDTLWFPRCKECCMKGK